MKIIIRYLLAVIITIATILPATQVSAASSWLADYCYRKSLTVAHSSGALTDYQMPFIVHKWLAFQDYASNPVISPGGGWEGDNIYALSVLTNPDGSPIIEGGVMRGYYGGFDGTNDRIGTATSSNGLTWTKYGSNPVITIGAVGTFDALHVNDPCVVKAGSTYYLWYSAAHPPNDGQIGLATSSDGVTWTKYGSAPVMAENDGLGAYEYFVNTPSVIYEDSVFRMWYQGWTSDLAQVCVCYATSSDGITWTRAWISL